MTANKAAGYWERLKYHPGVPMAAILSQARTLLAELEDEDER